MVDKFRDEEFTHVTDRDFAIATWQGLAYNGALLRTILQNQMIMMRKMDVVGEDVDLNKEINETIWEHFESMKTILEKLAPLNVDLKYRLRND